MIRLAQPCVLALYLCFASFAIAQPDTHVEADPAKSLYQRSSWAHGYAHGYEMGFHDGNLDLHMGRPTRDPHSLKGIKQGSHSFKNAFGNKSEFERGYKSGFEVGYLDGARGTEFRVASEASELSNHAAALLPATGDKLDSALEGGYSLGRKIGLNDARANAAFDSDKAQCPAAPGYHQLCDAYKVGFRWGYDDGYSNQKPDTATRRASR